jgi:hypothetical protein
MNEFWITLAALLAVHLGFAALLGTLVYRLRASKSASLDLLILAFGLIVYVGASLALPFGPGVRSLFWMAGLATMLVFAFQLEAIPNSPGMSWYYAAGAMILILVWSLSKAWPVPMLTMGMAAAAAAALAWRRALQAAN